ncbi:MAG TPA: hypothetical protein VM432_13220 [Bdellovibrionales bacterium]|nr:hypothetical protein [Bdellovibrionales bacterium]
MTNSLGERGSVTLETIAMTKLAILILTGGLLLSFVMFARTWLKRSAYETAVCLATGAPKLTCEGELKVLVEGTLPVGNLVIRRIYVDQRTAEVDLTWNVSELTLHIHEKLKLPLVSPEEIL